MKYSLYKKIICAYLAALLLLVVLPAGNGAAAAGEIYVNDPQSVLDGGLGGAYAVGGSGSIEQVSGTPAYAITGTGVEQVGSTPPPSPSPSPTPVTPSTQPRLVRIGIAYNKADYEPTILSPISARLRNYVGSGFEFGFYDAELNYHKVGSTAETDITVVKDTTVDLAAGRLGCYHILRPGSYTTFEAAKNAAAQYSDGFPAYYNNTFYVLTGAYATNADAQAALSSLGVSGSVFTASDKCVTVVKTGTTKILFEFDCKNFNDFSLAVRPVSPSGKAKTFFKDNNYTYFGDFQFTRMYTGTSYDGNLTVVNIVDIEDYIKGVVPEEMGANWPIEALKAQAVCARTYALANLNKHQSNGFDLCGNVGCQAYYGNRKATDHSNSAVDATKGQVVRYGGKLCSTLFSSSVGGATEDSENVFVTALAYLRGVIDPFEASITFDYYGKSWESTKTGGTIYSTLNSKGYTMRGNVTSVTPSLSNMGNVIALTFTDSTGFSRTIEKDLCRTVLGLSNIRYSVTKLGDGSFYFKGSGWGHNVGMSQYGAYAAANYHDKTYVEILEHYYTGVSVG